VKLSSSSTTHGGKKQQQQQRQYLPSSSSSSSIGVSMREGLLEELTLVSCYNMVRLNTMFAIRSTHHTPTA
jgi:hypothetical protein